MAQAHYLTYQQVVDLITPFSKPASSGLFSLFKGAGSEQQKSLKTKQAEIATNLLNNIENIRNLSDETFTHEALIRLHSALTDYLFYQSTLFGDAIPTELDDFEIVINQMVNFEIANKANPRP